MPMVTAWRKMKLRLYSGFVRQPIKVIFQQKALEEIKAKEDMSITPSLPKPTEVKAAIQRAVDFIDIETFDAKLLIISKLRAADVINVPGCVYESKRKVNCIVQLDFGMNNVMYMQLPLSIDIATGRLLFWKRLGKKM